MGIPVSVLKFETHLGHYNVATRLSWAANRQTTREEDTAYCLFGIFDVNLPLLYGEGPKAFLRLQEAILSSIDDFSIFAWASSASASEEPCGFLATSPSSFKSLEQPETLKSSEYFSRVSNTAGSNLNALHMLENSSSCLELDPAWITSRGIKLSLPVPQVSDNGGETSYVVLHSSIDGFLFGLQEFVLTVQTTRSADSVYIRSTPGKKALAWRNRDMVENLPQRTIYLRAFVPLTRTGTNDYVLAIKLKEFAPLKFAPFNSCECAVLVGQSLHEVSQNTSFVPKGYDRVLVGRRDLPATLLLIYEPGSCHVLLRVTFKPPFCIYEIKQVLPKELIMLRRHFGDSKQQKHGFKTLSDNDTRDRDSCMVWYKSQDGQNQSMEVHTTIGRLPSTRLSDTSTPTFSLHVIAAQGRIPSRL
jgi:hypothetical protein